MAKQIGQETIAHLVVRHFIDPNPEVAHHPATGSVPQSGRQVGPGADSGKTVIAEAEEMMAVGGVPH